MTLYYSWTLLLMQIKILYHGMHQAPLSLYVEQRLKLVKFLTLLNMACRHFPHTHKFLYSFYNILRLCLINYTVFWQIPILLIFWHFFPLDTNKWQWWLFDFFIRQFGRSIWEYAFCYFILPFSYLSLNVSSQNVYHKHTKTLIQFQNYQIYYLK